MINIAIFVSGNGTNCENIIRFFQNSDKICSALVISNRTDAYALIRAKNLGVPTKVLTKQQINDSDYLLPLLRQFHIDFIVLAGFLLMIPDYLIDAFPRKIINLHPALLPKFGGVGMYGHYVHEAVLAAGEKESGCTIHSSAASSRFQCHSPVREG